MNKNLTAAVMAGTLGITFALTPAYAAEYGSWKLIGSELTRSEFIPDADAPASRYGTWALIDAQYDKQWLANSSRTEPISTREAKRTLTADKLTYGANYTGQVKTYDAQKASVEYRNEYNKEELMGTDNYKSLSGSYAYTLQNFRIDNHKDKYVHKPYTSTFNYDETLKHTYTFDITTEKISRVYFKDAIDNTETSADLTEYFPGNVVTETGYAETGKKLTYSQTLPSEAPRINSVKLAATGTDIEGPFHQVAQGPKQQRVIGETVKRNDMISSALTENASDKVLNSNTQVGGKASRKVTSKGMEAYNKQGLASMKESEKTVTVGERKSKVGKAFSDSVDKLTKDIAKVADKGKKVDELIQSVTSILSSADTQDKQDYLKQAIAIALAETPLASSVQQQIFNILEGKSADSGTTTVSQKNSDKDDKDDKDDKTEKTTPKSTLTTVVNQVVDQVPLVKADPLEVLLNNLSTKNRELVYYLNQARSASDPLAYIKKAAAYEKTAEDSKAINAILDEQLNKAKDEKNKTLIKGLEDFKALRSKTKK